MDSPADRLRNWAGALAEISGSHDVRLAGWGPYSQKYLGISHVPDMRKAIRFDVSAFAGIYRRTAVAPAAKRDVGVHPWEAAPDLSYYRFRHELIWKDRLYCDVDYCRLNENAVLIGAHLVNNTDLLQPLAMQYVASLNFPPLRPLSDEVLRPCRVELPAAGLWVNGMDYSDVCYNRCDPRIHLVNDGHLRGEMRGHGFVDGTALGMGFGVNEGDSVTYRVLAPVGVDRAVLVLRYRTGAGEQARFTLQGLVETEMALNGTGEITTAACTVGDIGAGETYLRFTANGGSEVQLDGFALVAEESLAQLRFPEVVWHHVPERLPGSTPDSLILRYEDIDVVYGMAWEHHPAEVRDILDNSLEPWAHRMCTGALHQPNPTLKGNGAGHFTNVCLRPIIVPPSGQTTVYGLVCAGNVDQVCRALADFNSAEHDYAAINAQARARKVDLRGSPAGQKYLFSMERMAATTATNVLYPVRTRGRYIRHYTPGRLYETMYTWDSGFIGIGLMELDIDRALDVLNAYLTEPGEAGAAFIHHGSPVPTQFYLFWELWNQTGSQQLLEYFYPRLQQYYLFLAGRADGSTTRNLRSNLLRTWDYFYNSGGWDDYPPQAYVHAHKLTQTVAPVANTAHAIRTAKMLRTMAINLGQDTRAYDEDIAQVAAALQQLAWDAQSGYFGYVRHNAAGEPTGILRHESGCNFNMGLDGVMPLVADICTPQQEKALLDLIMQPGRLWSAPGISTVDQAAPYYHDDGYWNGSVWQPYQWFLWKAMLDLGCADAAAKVAGTALDVWRREVADSYNCWEHINIQTGRGVGWHHFGGLSTPVLCWYGAYYRPGRITGGFNLHVEWAAFSADNRELEAVISITGQSRHAPVVIITLTPANAYKVTLNGTSLRFMERHPGTLEVTVPAAINSGKLQVEGGSC